MINEETLSAEMLEQLFPTTPVEFKEATYLSGKGKIENGRFIVSLKLDDVFKKHIKNKQISINIIERKEVDQFGNSHFITLCEDDILPANQPFGKTGLTTCMTHFNAIKLTLTSDQLKQYSYKFKPTGSDTENLYMKIELAQTSDGRWACFRFFKEQSREIKIWKSLSNAVATANTVVNSASVKSSVKNKNKKSVIAPATTLSNKEVDDFFDDL